MKVHLLYRDRDPVRKADPPPGAADLARDLGLDELFDHMSAGDSFRRDVVRATVLAPLATSEEIRWRQAVLRDFLDHPDVAIRLYELAMQGLESRREVRSWYVGREPTWVLSHAVDRLEVLVQPLKDLRQFGDEHQGVFQSAGMRDLVGTIRDNLTDEYFAAFQDHLARLRFPTGVVVTAGLGYAAKTSDVVLRKPADIRLTWRDWLGLPRNGEFTYRLAERDEAGSRAMSELRDRGLNRVADAAARSADHIISFYGALRWEVAFYLGCLALHDSLSARGMPTCLPDPRATQEIRLNACDLYDPTLVLATKTPVVGNDLDADGRSIIVITGANQGGKSTLLRSIGLAQTCMQAGVFVAATSYVASLSPTIHTHFTREEDASMESGKLDEELRRMSAIADRVRTRDLVLFNESFACTNEREGSSIARSVIDALDEAGVRIVMVTHMFDLAHGLAEEGKPQALFLRPERLDDGRRTFKLVPGAPLPTSHGHDLYEKVFGAAASN